MRSTPLSHIAAFLFAAWLPVAAQAARPLATDDAVVNERGVCQLESWAEKAGHERAYILSAGCGLGHDVDAGLSLTHVHPRNKLIGVLGASLKWAPSQAQFDTAAGQLRLASRIDFDTSQPVAGGWELYGAGAHAVATLDTGHHVDLHLNLGVREDKSTHRASTLLSLGSVWTVLPQWLLFAELQTNDNAKVVGGAQRTGGCRWWLQPEKLGLDLSATRAVGGRFTTWSLGFGWYRIGL